MLKSWETQNVDKCQNEGNAWVDQIIGRSLLGQTEHTLAYLSFHAKLV